MLLSSVFFFFFLRKKFFWTPAVSLVRILTINSSKIWSCQNQRHLKKLVSPPPLSLLSQCTTLFVVHCNACVRACACVCVWCTSIKIKRGRRSFELLYCSVFKSSLFNLHACNGPCACACVCFFSFLIGFLCFLFLPLQNFRCCSCFVLLICSASASFSSLPRRRYQSIGRCGTL